jgi:hypothetical protein
MMQRRHWLASALAWAGHSAWARTTLATQTAPRPLQVLTSWPLPQHLAHPPDPPRYVAGLWSPHTAVRAQHGLALPARAHQVLALPPAPGSRRPLALAVARRPGEYLLRFDPVRRQALQWHTMEEDRYLAGHAVLSPDASALFTTETDAATGQGLVVERDPSTLQKRREFASGGIGPHAVLLEPGSDPAHDTLLVANGGILNLPETGRRKLNLGRMDSNLARIHLRTGAVLATYRLDDPDTSLRHLARAPDGTVGVALQAEHATPGARHSAPALALLDGSGLRAVPMPMPIGPNSLATWDGYAGDIAVVNGYFWVSAPHAGLLMRWTAQGTNPVVAVHPGAGALAAHQGQLAVGGTQEAWDNHAQYWDFHTCCVS